MQWSRIRHCLVATIAAGTCGLMADQVLAQPGGGGGRGDRGAAFGGRGGGGFGGGRNAGAYYRSSDLDAMAELLNLDPEQTAMVEALLNGHEDVNRAAREEQREQFTELRDEMRNGGADWSEMGERMAEMSERFQELSKAAETAVIADIHSVLTDAQIDSWPRFERHVRRERTISRGQLAGERVDLFKVLETSEIDTDSPELAETLASYERELDRALVARNDFSEESQQQLRDLMSNQDMDAATAMMKKEAQLRTRVRDINEQYAKNIAGKLDGDSSALFTDTFRREAYNRVYRETSTQRAYDMAVGFEDLEPDNLRSIETIHTNYLAELARRNEQVVRTMREHEPQRNMDRIERMAARFSGQERGEEAPDPIQEAFRTRHEFDTQYRQMLEAKLTAEQIDRLPEHEEFRDGNRGRRGGREGGGFNREQMMERFDTDKNGELSEEERDAMRQQFRDGGGRGGRGGRDRGLDDN